MSSLNPLPASRHHPDGSPLTIVGAGPVGLLLGALLGKQGRDVRILEQRVLKPEGSMAIGITPPSLDILEKLDLKTAFLQNGVLIRKAHVFENQKAVGELVFRSSENAILSFPQLETLKILEEKIAEFPSVTLERGKTFTEEDLEEAEGWVVACDGSKGALREMAGIRGQGHRYGVSFVMADFPDLENLGSDARLYFSKDGAVESFPLPDTQRRWIAQLPYPSTLEDLMDRVKDAAGMDLRDRSSSPLCSFSPRWFLADRYVSGHVILCGDSAHVMSPIGGQGMNTGFGDAMMLSEVLSSPSASRLHCYTQERQKAFRIAARRAAAGMWLGTRKGKMASRLRAAALKTMLGIPGTHHTLARSYSMRNLPHPCNP